MSRDGHAPLVADVFQSTLGRVRYAIRLRKGAYRGQADRLGDHVARRLRADEDGKFDWAKPDEEMQTFLSDLDRPVGAYLCGRRMYEVMVAWETGNTAPDQPSSMRDFAEIWQPADKIGYSKALGAVSSARTRIERAFDSSRRWVAQTKWCSFGVADLV
jgi:hypothetical protein